MARELKKENIDKVEEDIQDISQKVEDSDLDNAIDLINGISKKTSKTDSVDFDKIVRIQIRESVKNLQYFYNGEVKIINELVPNNVGKNKYSIKELTYGEYLSLRNVASNYFKRGIFVMLDSEVLSEDEELKSAMIAIATISDLDWVHGNLTLFRQNIDKIPVLLGQQFIWAIKRNKKAQDGIKHYDKSNIITKKFGLTVEELENIFSDSSDTVNIAN